MDKEVNALCKYCNVIIFTYKPVPNKVYDFCCIECCLQRTDWVKK